MFFHPNIIQNIHMFCICLHEKESKKKILCSKKGVNFSLERAYLDRKKILSIISGKNFVERIQLAKPSRAKTVLETSQILITSWYIYD